MKSHDFTSGTLAQSARVQPGGRITRYQCPGSYVPLIAADKRRVDSLTLIAQTIARDSGRIVRLVKFASREVVREFYGTDDRPNIRVNAVSLSGE